MKMQGEALNIPDGEGKLYRDVTELRNWLGGQTSGSSTPEGFLLLSHHARGYLWFEEKGQRIAEEHVKREFAPGSVAFLSACTVANPEGDNRPLLKTLNDKGIDAMIVSPFPVRANYGSLLAKNVIAVIRSKRAAGDTATLGDIFATAAGLTARELAQDNAKVDEMALEFVLLGDHNIRLCKPQTGLKR